MHNHRHLLKKSHSTLLCTNNPLLAMDACSSFLWFSSSVHTILCMPQHSCHHNVIENCTNGSSKSVKKSIKTVKLSEPKVLQSLLLRSLSTWCHIPLKRWQSPTWCSAHKTNTQKGDMRRGRLWRDRGDRSVTGLRGSAVLYTEPSKWTGNDKRHDYICDSVKTCHATCVEEMERGWGSA